MLQFGPVCCACKSKVPGTCTGSVEVAAPIELGHWLPCNGLFKPQARALGAKVATPSLNPGAGCPECDAVIVIFPRLINTTLVPCHPRFILTHSKLRI